MKFEERRFSKRLPPVECAIIVVHEHHDSVLRGTGAALVLPNGRAWIGVALCAPGDQFVKTTGRTKATGRAVKAFAAGPSHCHALILEGDPMKTIIDTIKSEIRIARSRVLDANEVEG